MSTARDESSQPLREGLRRWIAELTDGVEALVDLRRTPGATNASVYVVTTTGQKMALRVYPSPDAPSRQLVAFESYSLQTLEQLGYRAPIVLGTDTAGAYTGGPSILQSWLEGSVLASQSHLSDSQVESFARRVCDLHTVTLQPLDPIDSVRWPALDGAPGEALRRMWTDFVARLSHGPTYSLCHLDLTPMNALDDGESVSMVDWVRARLAPWQLDVAYARLGLWTLFGPMSAERFLSAYLRLSPEADYDPRWDLAPWFEIQRAGYNLSGAMELKPDLNLAAAGAHLRAHYRSALAVSARPGLAFAPRLQEPT